MPARPRTRKPAAPRSRARKPAEPEVTDVVEQPQMHDNQLETNESDLEQRLADVVEEEAQPDVDPRLNRMVHPVHAADDEITFDDGSRYRLEEGRMVERLADVTEE